MTDALTTNRDVLVFTDKPVKNFEELSSRLSAQFELVSDASTDDDIPNYWQNITELNKKQEAKGVSKYGQNLEDNITLSTVQRIEHLQE